MRMPVSILAALLILSNSVRAQPKLQQELKDTDIADHWIYDDLPKAREKAKETGKPMLVVLRCVPCPPGKTLDRAVNQPDEGMKALEDKFVCVRVIQTNGLDLKLFQYDYDNSWAAMFMNADGTIYGRYGTRTTSGPQSDWFHNVPSFRKSMERALEVHKGYPGNKESLAGKVGKAPDYPVPEKIPGLADKGARAATRQSCIHCHMVREYQLRAKWQDKKLTLEDLWVYPMPNRIGLKIDDKDGLTVQGVTADTPASKAGLKEGDELVRLNGQPLLSLADIQWVLHNVPAETTLKATVKRKGETLDKEIALKGNWKESDIGWRASSWYGLRQGLKTEPLPAAEREKRGIEGDKLALAVKGMFGKGAPKLQQAGLRVGDVIVAVDGKTPAMTESQFLVDLRLRHGPDDSVRLTVLRGDRRMELTVPMW
jgi:hypothetical protein